MIVANLIERENLIRYFHVLTDEGVFEVIYNGTGLGYEEVLVNGEIANRQRSYLWYVPKFDFMIGSVKCQIKVQVSLLLKIKAFSLSAGGVVIYHE